MRGDPAPDLADHERMNGDEAAAQEPDEVRPGAPQTIDPDRRADKEHEVFR